MIITKPRDWGRIVDELRRIGARSVFVMGCGQCATVAGTGGEPQVAEAAERLRAEGFEIEGTTVSEVACHLLGTKAEVRKSAATNADAILVMACGAGVQTIADAAPGPVLPGLESAFLGTVIRGGVYEERCQMCGECVLDATAGICPVTTCPKGLLNGPCGGMWEGQCEVIDRECTFVRIHRRLSEQGRPGLEERILPAKDHSKKLKPGKVDLRASGSGRAEG